MKHLLPFLITLLLLAGCHRSSTTGTLCTELQRAEALMYPHPDSALHILQAMTPPTDELNRATWALFTTQAKYKLYQTQSDSLLNIALPYFMKTEDAQRRALVLYYRASLYNEEKKVEEAQEYYLNAAEEVEKTEDYQLGHLVYAELGGIYIYRPLLEQALDAYKKAHEYARMASNYKQETASCIYLGRTYTSLKDYEKAVDCYLQAIEMSKAHGEQSKQIYALSELAGVYRNIEDYTSALRCIKEAIDLRQKDNIKVSEQQYLVLGEIYKSLNQNDSASFYLKKATSSDNIYTRREAITTLSYLNKTEKRYEDAFSYFEQAWILHDSITKLDKSRTLIEMQEKYDQQKVKDEAETELRLQKQRTQMYIGGIILAVLLVGAYARHRYRQRIARLAEAEERIDTLNRMLEEAQQATDEDDAFVKRMLLQQLGVIRLVANTPTAQNQALLRRLAELGNDQVPVEELIVWEDLYPIIDRLYNGFHSRLKERFGSLLTDKEVQTCCLLCAGFSTKEIGVITHQSASSIYVRKTAIRKKLGAEEGADIVEVVRAKSIDSSAESQ